MKLDPEQRLVATFNYTSLTDVVMLLLIFFLLSSSFIAEPTIKVQLPDADAADPRVEQSIIITVTEQGALYLNGASMAAAELQKALTEQILRHPERPVQIRADKDVTLQQTVRVIDMAKAAGASKFMIATEPGGTGK